MKSLLFILPGIIVFSIIACNVKPEDNKTDVESKVQQGFDYGADTINIIINQEPYSQESLERRVRLLRLQHPDLIIRVPGQKILSEDKEFEERAEEWAEDNLEELNERYGH